MKSVLVNFRMDKEEFEQFKKVCDEKDTLISKVIRRSIKEYVNMNNKEAK